MPIPKTKNRTRKQNKVHKTYAKEWAESGSPHQGWAGSFDLCGTNSETINQEFQQSNLGYIVHNF